MAIFTNQAQLRYGNAVANSNVAVGEILEVLAATKTAVRKTYGQNDRFRRGNYTGYRKGNRYRGKWPEADNHQIRQSSSGYGKWNTDLYVPYPEYRKYCGTGGNRRSGDRHIRSGTFESCGIV